MIPSILSIFLIQPEVVRLVQRQGSKNIIYEEGQWDIESILQT